MDVAQFKDLIRDRKYYEAAHLLMADRNPELELKLIIPLYHAWKGGEQCWCCKGTGRVGEWTPEEMLRLVDRVTA